MLTLLAFLELLHSRTRGIMHWMCTRHRLYYRSKTVSSASKYNHRHSPQKPEWLKAEIIRLKALMPKAGCRSIADICNRRFAASHKITVGKTYVHQILQQHDYEIKILRRNLKHAKPKAIPRNLIWGIDLTGKTDTNKNLHALFGIIDHGSRTLLHLQALRDKTSRTLIDCLNQTIRAHGKPKTIRTDNEAIFTSRIFRCGLKLLGIRHQLTDPGCPWQNGRIERLFGTLKQKLDQRIYLPLPQAGEGLGEITSDLPACGLSRMASSSIRGGVREQLNRDLNVFRYWYNHIRPHQNLDGKTPAEAWCGDNPFAKPPKQEHWFEAWDGLLMGYELKC